MSPLLAFARLCRILIGYSIIEVATNAGRAFFFLPAAAACMYFGSSVYAQSFTNVAGEHGISAIPGSFNFGSGLSFYDFDKDGFDDLSFTMTNDSLRFYRSTGTGFELLSSFAYGAGETKSVLWADYDNDGDADLFITVNEGRHMLLQNDGNFNFTDVSLEAGLVAENERFYGASFGDYDRDGYLDIYVCVYAFSPGPLPALTTNRLYRNNGDGTFTDVTDDAGVGDGIKLSFQSVWMDYDNDGWPDLFVINDRFYANSLYKNNGDGTFTDVSEAAGIEFAGQDPMTATVGDFNNNGYLDIYMTNTGVPGKLPKLPVNNGDGTFTESAQEYGVTFNHWSWGAVWADFDNDGYQDLYATTANPSPLEVPVANQVFVNNYGSFFTSGSSLFQGNHIALSHAVAKGDFKGNGRCDLAVLNEDSSDVFLWENEYAVNNFIKITPQGTASNKDAIGTKIEVFTGETVQMHYTMCGENYLSQNSQHHIFGLGPSEMIDSVAVTYLSGHRDTYIQPAINTHHYFTEGDTYATGLSLSGHYAICEGDSLTAQVGNHFQYAWSTGDTIPQITVNSPGTYTLTATNMHGVQSVDSFSVSVHPLPEILQSVQNATCAGSEDGSAELINLSGPAPQSVVWSHGAFGPSLSGLAAGSFAYIYTDVNGCTAEGTVNVGAPSPLAAEVFVSPNSEGGGTVLLLVSGGVAPYEVTASGAEVQGFAFEVSAPGSYEVLITDANGCTIEVTAEVQTLSYRTRATEAGFRLFPNPATDHVRFTFDLPLEGAVLTMTDVLGKTIVRERLNGLEHRLNLGGIRKGTYMLSLENKGRIQASKLIVE